MIIAKKEVGGRAIFPNLTLNRETKLVKKKLSMI
jgi:hypothetical protein